jgi:hypothetical protein
LLASTGWGQSRYDWTLADAINRLHSLGVVSESIRGSFDTFGGAVQTIAGGNEQVAAQELLNALDVGVFTFRALAAIPRERHYVVHSDLPVYQDGEGRSRVPGVFAVVLRTIGQRPRAPRDQAFLSTRNGYAIGAEVSWGWKTNPPACSVPPGISTRRQGNTPR